VQDLVSVVTIFRNEQRFLGEAIASVFGQEYGPWELLLVDDGSVDSSTEIARQYAKRCPDRVRFLEHPGHASRGMSASRNLGVRSARGGYIALLDADDVWLPGKLRHQVAILESHPSAGMVFGTSRYWHGWTGDPEDARRDHERGLTLRSPTLFCPPQLTVLLYPLGNGPAPCPSDLLIRADVARRTGGFEERFTGVYQLYEDQAFLSKVYLSADVVATGECHCLYRRHPDSCVSSVLRDGHYDRVRWFFLRWLEQYLKENGIDDPRVSELLQAASWRFRHPMLHSLRTRSNYYLKPRNWKTLATKTIAACRRAARN
jgi:glycosyltransferase involved in cell wall biosynthesis